MHTVLNGSMLSQILCNMRNKTVFSYFVCVRFLNGFFSKISDIEILWLDLKYFTDIMAHIYQIKSIIWKRILKKIFVFVD